MIQFSKKIDLHTHSIFSDGTLSPSDLIDLAKKRKIAAIAITDHDTMAGTNEAMARGRMQDVEVIPGVEISAKYKDLSVHILGYGLRQDDEKLQRHLAKVQQLRLNRNKTIISKLNMLGIPSSLEEIKRTEHGLIGRPHIAQLLVEKKIVKNVNEAFARYLKRGGLAFVEITDRFPAQESITIIKDAGGLAMLAHPGSIAPTLSALAEIIKELAEHGLDGIEAYYPAHSAQTRKKLITISNDYNLLLCGGTDFHGGNRSNIPLGGSAKTGTVPYHILSAIKERLSPQ